jgi:hypothetical protein
VLTAIHKFSPKFNFLGFLVEKKLMIYHTGPLAWSMNSKITFKVKGNSNMILWFTGALIISSDLFRQIEEC